MECCCCVHMVVHAIECVYVCRLMQVKVYSISLRFSFKQLFVSRILFCICIFFILQTGRQHEQLPFLNGELKVFTKIYKYMISNISKTEVIMVGFFLFSFTWLFCRVDLSEFQIMIFVCVSVKFYVFDGFVSIHFHKSSNYFIVCVCVSCFFSWFCSRAFK